MIKYHVILVMPISACINVYVSNSLMLSLVVSFESNNYTGAMFFNNNLEAYFNSGHQKQI
jgi:hypothetical protein